MCLKHGKRQPVSRSYRRLYMCAFLVTPEPSPFSELAIFSVPTQKKVTSNAPPETLAHLDSTSTHALTSCFSLLSLTKHRPGSLALPSTCPAGHLGGAWSPGLLLPFRAFAAQYCLRGKANGSCLLSAQSSPHTAHPCYSPHTAQPCSAESLWLLEWLACPCHSSLCTCWADSLGPLPSSSFFSKPLLSCFRPNTSCCRSFVTAGQLPVGPLTEPFSIV